MRSQVGLHSEFARRSWLGLVCTIQQQ